MILPTDHSPSSRPSRKRGHPSVFLTSGGGFGAAPTCIDALGADLLVCCDVRAELPEVDDPRVVRVTLAEGHTLATLAESAGCDAQFLRVSGVSW